MVTLPFSREFVSSRGPFMLQPLIALPFRLLSKPEEGQHEENDDNQPDDVDDPVHDDPFPFNRSANVISKRRGLPRRRKDFAPGFGPV
jgi:hypothetical protein